MAVSYPYLDKIRRAVRRSKSDEVDEELVDIIEECRLDLQSLGVISTKANDETDSLVLGAVRCFARWKFGLSNEDAAANRDDYFMMRDEMRRKRDYTSYAITFVVMSWSALIADAEITFNGETIETGADGTAIFYYVKAGTNQEYIVSAEGYVSQTVDLDVTASATVTVSLIAG